MAIALFIEQQIMVQFSNQAWDKIAPIYQAIIEMPFIKELESGSLDKGVFQQYIVQDGIYLGEFARALAIISAKAPHPEEQLRFASSVSEAIVVERSLHENFFARFGIEPLQALATEPSPTCLNYTNFLLATAYQYSFPVAVAAVLPCFWIYLAVGKHIYQQASSKENPYQLWIDTYVDPEFKTSVNYVIQTADKVGQKASEAETELMHRVFYRAAQFEWMFWDSAYKKEQWLI